MSVNFIVYAGKSNLFNKYDLIYKKDNVTFQK